MRERSLGRLLVYTKADSRGFNVANLNRKAERGDAAWIMKTQDNNGRDGSSSDNNCLYVHTF